MATTIRFFTAKYGRDQKFLVTLRAAPDWSLLHRGEYNDSKRAWEYTLPDAAPWDQPFEYKFYIDGDRDLWCNDPGANFALARTHLGGLEEHDDSDVQFRDAPAATGVLKTNSLISSVKAVGPVQALKQSWLTIVLSLLAGGLAAVVQAVTFGAPWDTLFATALLIFPAIGISPMTKQSFQNLVHLSPAVTMFVTGLVTAGGGFALKIDDETLKAVVMAVITFVASLGFGASPGTGAAA